MSLNVTNTNSVRMNASPTYWNAAMNFSLGGGLPNHFRTTSIRRSRLWAPSRSRNREQVEDAQVHRDQAEQPDEVSETELGEAVGGLDDADRAREALRRLAQ